MKFSRILFACAALIMMSCQPQTDRDKLKSEEVNPDGSVLKRTFKPDGKLFAEIQKKDGKKNGVTKNYYANGKVQVETNFVNDSKEGWADAFVLGLTTWFEGRDIKFDYSFVRPAGARLCGFRLCRPGAARPGAPAGGRSGR